MRHIHHRGHVHHDLVVIGLMGVGEELTACGEAGIVHQVIDGEPELLRLLIDVLRPVFLAEVGRDDRCVHVPLLLQFCCQLLQFPRLAGDEDDVHSFGCELSGKFFPDAG